MKTLTKIIVLVLMCISPAYSLLGDCFKNLKIDNVKVYQFHVDKYKIDTTMIGYWITKQLNDYGIKSSETKQDTYLSIVVSIIDMKNINGVMYTIRTEVLKPNNDGSFVRYFYTDDYGLVSVTTYSDDIQNSIKGQVNSFVHFWVKSNKLK